MKIWLRFSLYFSVGLLLFILYLMTVMSVSPFLLGIFFPHLAVEHVLVLENDDLVDWLIPVSFLFSLLSGGVLFSIFFVRPVFQIISFLPKLSLGERIIHNKEIFNSQGKPKIRYLPFKNVIKDIQNLERDLHYAEEERKRIEVAKKDWLAGISHDIKTPLSYITGYSSLLLYSDYEFTSVEIKNSLDQIYQKSLYIEKMVEDLNLSFYLESDGLQLRLEEVDLVDLVQNVVNDVIANPKSQKDIISFLSKEKMVSLNVDAKLIYRALHNLIMNAVEHNPPQTKVMILLERNESNQLIIQITDNGKGMNPETVKRCFEKYSDSENKTHVKGLGISIAYNILKAHGMEIEVESEVGSGTKFTILSPRL